MTSSKPARSSHHVHHEDSVPLTSLFAIELAPYKPPSSHLGAFLWRKRVWLEVTFGVSVLEPWEKILYITVLTVLSSLFGIWIYKYLPHQLSTTYARARYYVSGQEHQALI
ncbi:hypothetical protein EW146_g4310 [Bondarzewia mesenterica]|uniref:Uncharacterized protein n=1 Tax=Bondarzewia mesenterica TaxID=1095465 RepID=A0A4S4LX58_9AGAM|nr:hypothetical protein EW146_g4310 [Bondarzewia mesenterica]